MNNLMNINKYNEEISPLIAIMIVALIVLASGTFVYYYFTTQYQFPVVVPAVPLTQMKNQTAGWKTQVNTQYGFALKYPANFFDAGHEPKIFVGDCSYNILSNTCPNINNMVINYLAGQGGDIAAIRSNLSQPNYWKNPNGEITVIQNIPYCLYQTQDAAMSHTYNYYYYTTIVDNKCLVVNFDTSATNCQVYLPLETGNIQQQKNYNDCFTKNRLQPAIVNRIVNTFTFTTQNQTACTTNSDCQPGASCLVKGPMMAGQPIRKVCVPPGQAVPL